MNNKEWKWSTTWKAWLHNDEDWDNVEKIYPLDDKFYISISNIWEPGIYSKIK